MTIIENERAMNEVLDFAKAIKFLFGGDCPKDLPVEIVEDIPDDFTHSGYDGKSYNDLTDGELTFSELKSEELMCVTRELGRDSEKNRLAARARRILTGKTGILSGISTLLPQEYIKKDCDQIILEDLLFCAQFRAAFGVKGGFWETVFQIYKSGGMPVGWSGHYPRGKLIAIYPGL